METTIDQWDQFEGDAEILENWLKTAIDQVSRLDTSCLSDAIHVQNQMDLLLVRSGFVTNIFLATCRQIALFIFLCY